MYKKLVVTLNFTIIFASILFAQPTTEPITDNNTSNKEKLYKKDMTTEITYNNI